MSLQAAHHQGYWTTMHTINNQALSKGDSVEDRNCLELACCLVQHLKRVKLEGCRRGPEQHPITQEKNSERPWETTLQSVASHHLGRLGSCGLVTRLRPGGCVFLVSAVLSSLLSFVPLAPMCGWCGCLTPPLRRYPVRVLG